MLTVATIKRGVDGALPLAAQTCLLEYWYHSCPPSICVSLRLAVSLTDLIASHSSPSHSLCLPSLLTVPIAYYVASPFFALLRIHSYNLLLLGYRRTWLCFHVLA